MRGLAAVGATILAEKDHEPMMRPLIETPHTNPPDALELRRKAGKAGAIEFFEGKKVISDGGAVAGALRCHRHPARRAEGAGVRARSGGVLFQSDLCSPAPARRRVPTPLRSCSRLTR